LPERTFDWFIALALWLSWWYLFCFSKAIDNVAFCKLLYKPSSLGITGKPLARLAAFQHNRSQCVAIENVFSSDSSFVRFRYYKILNNLTPLNPTDYFKLHNQLIYTWEPSPITDCWNSLPSVVHNIKSLPAFKSVLRNTDLSAFLRSSAFLFLILIVFMSTYYRTYCASASSFITFVLHFYYYLIVVYLNWRFIAKCSCRSVPLNVSAVYNIYTVLICQSAFNK